VLKGPGDPLDDLADDARYGLYTFITSTEKPRELEMHDQLRHLAEQGDLTSAAIRFQLMNDEPQDYKPARLGRRVRRW
jgi:hypothetical protein